MKRRNAVIAGMFLASAAAVAWIAVISRAQSAGVEEFPPPASQPASQPAEWKEPLWEKPQPKVTKFYNIDDLLIPSRDYVVSGFWTEPRDAEERDKVTLYAAEPMGQSGDDHEGLRHTWQSEGRQDELRHIVSLMRDTVWPDRIGPMDGRVGSFQGTLVVRDTEKNHAAVAAFLAGLRAAGRREVVIEAAWVRGDQAQQQGLLLPPAKSPAGKGDVRLVDPAALAKANVPYRARLACRNGQQTYVAGGRAFSFVSTVQPEVSDGKTEYRPVIGNTFMGVSLQARAVLDPAGKTAHVNLRGEITRWPWDKPPEIPRPPFRASSLDFDLHQFQTTVRVPLGEWVMTSGGTQPPREKNKPADDQMVLLIRVQAAGE